MMRRLSGAFVAVLLLALSSSLVFAKPPDLPQNPTITVSDQPESMPQDGLRALLTSSLFFNVDPLIAEPVSQDEAASTPNEADFSCPGFCCGCCCAWLEQFGLCGISQLQQWCQQCFTQPVAEPVADKPCQIAITWQNKMAFAADPVHGGKPTPGFRGRVYLFGKSIGYPITADGSLLVELFDETNGTAVKRKQWEIDPQTLHRLLRKDFIGWGYTLFLPSGEYKPAMTSLRLRACFKPVKGGALYTESEVTLTACNKSPGVQRTSRIDSDEQPHGNTESACEGSGCPKCEALHAQYVARAAKCAGTDEQVTGLMKACYLAIGEGKFAKAADLARQAYALDAGRVEGDPLIYKMHLLTGKGDNYPCKKCGCGHQCEKGP